MTEGEAGGDGGDKGGKFVESSKGFGFGAFLKLFVFPSFFLIDAKELGAEAKRDKEFKKNEAHMLLS